MTSRDLMPIGKYKGQRLEDVPKGYAQWLCDQDWFISKYPDLYNFFTGGNQLVATPKEKETLSVEDEILSDCSPEFATWWDHQYGRRLRGSDLFIAHLRVAKEAWYSALSSGLTPTGTTTTNNQHNRYAHVRPNRQPQ